MSPLINKNVLGLITGISLLVTLAGIGILIYTKQFKPDTYQNELNSVLNPKYHNKRDNENDEVFSPKMVLITEPGGNDDESTIFEEVIEELIFSESPKIKTLESETEDTEDECASVTLTPHPNVSSQDVTITLQDIEPDNSQDYEVYEVVTGDGNVPPPESGFDQIQEHSTDRSDLDSSDIEGFFEENTQTNEYGLA